MRALLISFILPLALFINACGKAETQRLGHRIATNKEVDSGALRSQDFSPKLEILFVIDNSTSMEPHIARLSANIDKFVDGFTKNTPFQYNVAVMSVYDHRRFKGKRFQKKFGGTELEFDVGEFRPVKDRNGNTLPGKNFINSSDDDVAGKLKSTLKIGIQGLIGAGPEVEESFSPIAAAYSFGGLRQNSKTQAKQKGFFMGNDSYKVIFFVTDASDNSLISAGDLYLNLLARKAKGDRSKIMGFGAISTGNCKKDPGMKNSQLNDFLSLSRPDPKTQNVVSLCSDFGTQFAGFGKSIRKQVLSQSIPLREVPDFTSPNLVDLDEDNNVINECLKPAGDRNEMAVVVCYGSQRVFLRTTINGAPGYRFDPGTNSIRFDEDLEFDPSQKGASLTAEYTPIRDDSRRKGHVRAWGQ